MNTDRTLKHPKVVLTIVAEAVLEKELARDVLAHGAHGWTIADVRGGGHGGVREGAWEADRTIELKVVCDPPVADAIAKHVLDAYARNFGLTLWFSEVSVLRPERY